MFSLDNTVDVIFKTLVCGTAFVVNVTRLSCLPARPLLLKLTLITPVSPGAIGLRGQSGPVQPQEPWAFEIIHGPSPSFLKVNGCSATIPS